VIGETILGRYVVEQQLGRGAMGEVYKARDERLRCAVALKFLPEPHRFDEEARASLLREARALARIHHPGICNVRDLLEYQGTDVLVMEYVQGVTLLDHLSEGPLAEAEIVRLGVRLADGLAAAHAAGVLHRDLKPANLILAPDGQLKILDFGLAKLLRGSRDGSLSVSTSDPFTVRGTLPYIAPELLQGGRPHVGSDLFSVGCVLYEMATGRRAFPQEEGLAVWHALMNLDPPRPREIRPRFSTRMERVILASLAKDPSQRYGTMPELADALKSSRRWRFLPALPGLAGR
jgi:serine/threonine protein kinase